MSPVRKSAPRSRRASATAAPRARRSQASDSADNVQRILAHALHSFATRGYAATGLRAIAADAALTAPMVNYYFQRKDVLYQRVGAMVIDDMLAAVDAAIAEVDGAQGGASKGARAGAKATHEAEAPLAAFLEANMLAHLRYTAASPEPVRFLFGAMYGPDDGQPPLALDGYLRVEARVRERLDRAVRSGAFVLRDGVARDDVVELYQAFVMSLVMHDAKSARFGKPLSDPRHAARRLAILLDGLGAVGRRRRA